MTRAQIVERADMDHTNRTEIPASSFVSYEKIAARAYELWLQRGCIYGFDVENWCDAERGLLQEERDRERALEEQLIQRHS
jgi:Protein of unknown function (DUF2934)